MTWSEVSQCSAGDDMISTADCGYLVGEHALRVLHVGLRWNSGQVVQVAVEERDREEQEAVDYMSMDIVYLAVTSDHQGVSQEHMDISDTIEATTIKYFLCIFFGSLSVLIQCGNLLVITSILYFKQLHTPTNFLILSLAVADLLVGVLLLFYVMIPATEDSCVGLDTFEMYLCASSVWNLCFISVDRYYAVCQPLRYRTKINVCVIVIMILVSWIVSILNILIIGFQHTFGFYIPAIIMAAIYLKILMVAQRQARSIQNTTCQRTKSESKMERKATKTLAIVMGVFLICWTPYFLCWTFNPLINYKIPVPVLSAFTWLGWSNSLLNPFIYAFFYSWFRSAFRMIISGKIFQGDFTNSKLS
ncbi:trace amine-associated receptor 1-like [Symphorus nematophorus]